MASIWMKGVINHTELPLPTTEMTSLWTLDGSSQSANSLLNNCVILDVNSTVPWDNPHNLISFEAWSLFDRIKSAILIPILFLIGIPANLLNLAVFFKQGLQERINLCLFTLALVDILYLMFVFVVRAEQIFTWFTGEERLGPVFRFVVDNNITGFYGLSRASAFVSAVISIERCVCVLFPLQAQRCVPIKVFAFMVIAGVLVMALNLFLVMPMHSATCFYETRKQRLSWHLSVNDYYFRHQAMITALNGVFNGFIVTLGCPVIVFVATVITGVKLTHTARWRSQTCSSLSSKEIGVTKMLIALSVEFLVLSLPTILLTILPCIDPRLNAGQVKANFYTLLLSCNEFFTCTSASVNFFVYFFTGTRYRETLRACLFGHRTSVPSFKRTRPSSSLVSAREESVSQVSLCTYTDN